MKKLSRISALALALALASPLVAAWLPLGERAYRAARARLPGGLVRVLRQLSITLAATLAFASAITIGLGYLSIYSRAGARRSPASWRRRIGAVHPDRAVLLRAVSGYLARHAAASSSMVSLMSSSSPPP